MKNILFTYIVFILITFTASLIYVEYVNKNTPRAIREKTINTNEFKETSIVPDIIKTINKANSDIKTLNCKNLSIKIEQEGKVFGLKGFLNYEKNNNFRLKASSFAGLELEMGSNSTHFWFWSKRMQPKALYYCRHGYLHNTRLRSPFVPMWIMSSLGIDEIEKNSIFKESNGKIYASKDVESSNGKVAHAVIVDNNKIIGYYLFNSNNQITTLSQIETENNIPKRIYIEWKEENVSMELLLNNVTINNYVNRSTFNMPEYPKTINMEGY